MSEPYPSAGSQSSAFPRVNSGSSPRAPAVLICKEIPVDSKASILYADIWEECANDSVESRDIFPCRLVGRKGATLPVTCTAHTTTLDLAQHSAWFRGWLNQRSSMTGASTSLGRLQPPCAVDQKVLHDIVGALYKHSISLSNENVEATLCAADSMQIMCIVQACRLFILKHVLPADPAAVVHLAKKFADLDAIPAIKTHFLGKSIFTAKDEEALLSLLDDADDSVAKALIALLLDRAVCKLEVYRVVSRSTRSVDYLKLLDVNRLQKAEADALIRHIYKMTPKERSQPFWSELLPEAAMRSVRDVHVQQPDPKATFYADLDVESLRPDPRAANIRLHAGRLDGRDYQLLLQPDRETGVWGLYCASRGDFHKDEGKPIISLFILSQSTLGIYSMLMNASSPRELPFSGWGIAESFAKGFHALPAHAEQQKEKQTPGALSPDEWRSFKVKEVKDINHNTKLWRFALPDANQEVGLPVASCLVTRAPIGSEKEDGKKAFVIRPYTPTSETDAKGYFDLVVKVYPQGKMSKHIGDLKEGDTLDCKGPIPKLPYKANMKKHVGMVAGGSGVTPMLQVAGHILRNPEDKTKVSLIFCNQTEDDIVLKPEIDEMAKSDQFDVYYVLDHPKSKDWKGGVGYVTEDIAKKHLPPPSDDNLILVCGPPPMYKALSGVKPSPKDQGELTGLLKELGYTQEQVYKF